MAGTKTGDAPSPTDALPLDEFKEAGQELARAMMMRALTSANGRIRDLTERLNESTGDGESAGAKMFAAGAGELAKGKSPLRAGVSAGVTGAKEKVKDVAGAGGVKEKVKDVAGLGGGAKEKVKDVAGLVGGGEEDGGDAGGGEKEAKVVTIIEEFDVGLPLRTTYDQWTRFGDYPSFTSKVESVEQESDEKINWRAQIFLSHRSWESTIVEQVPDTRIVWKSTGAKGYVDGAVTFAELTPNLTRVLLVAEYHPDGFFEKTANLWRAQGRRLRLEFKHIKRHMMTRAVLEQDEVEGWRGEIRDGEVVKTHEDAVKEEQDSAKEEQGAEEQGAAKEEQGAEEQDSAKEEQGAEEQGVRRDDAG